MNLDSYATLSRLGPMVRTGEAAAALAISLSQASRSLRRLEALPLFRSSQARWRRFSSSAITL